MICEICKNHCKIKDEKLASACCSFDPSPLVGKQVQQETYMAVVTHGVFHRINSIKVEDGKIFLIPNKKARKNLKIPNDDSPVYFRLKGEEFPLVYIHYYQKDDREYTLLTRD